MLRSSNTRSIILLSRSIFSFFLEVHLESDWGTILTECKHSPHPQKHAQIRLYWYYEGIYEFLFQTLIFDVV